MNRDEKNRASHQTMMITWAMLVASQAMFGVVVYFVKPELFRFGLSSPIFGNDILVILGAAFAAFAAIIASAKARSHFIAKAIELQKVELVQTAMILGSALCEAASLIGVFLAFVADYPYWWVFLAAGALAMLVHMPRRANIDSATYRIEE